MMLEELIMQLIISINIEDLENVKNIIEKINTMDLSEEELNNIGHILDLTHTGNQYTNPIYNKCIDYILENLNISFYKEILFQRKQNQIRYEKKIDIIENYIQELLAQKEYPYAKNEKQVIQFLIEAITLLKDKNKISYYFSLVQNKFFNKGSEN